MNKGKSKVKAATPQPFITVGVSFYTVKEARLCIMDILKSTNDQSTKVAALDTLKNLCSVDNTNITNCSFER